MTERRIDWIVSFLLVAAVILPATGIIAAFATENLKWFWLCLPLVIFLN